MGNSAVTLIDSLFKAFLSCSHRRLGFPITVKHDPHGSGSRYARRTYVICLDCGTELPYSWDEMRIEKAEPAIIDACARQLTSWYESVRAALKKGVRLDIRCKLARYGAQEDRTWRIRIGWPLVRNSGPPPQNAHSSPTETASPSLKYFPHSLHGRDGKEALQP